MTQTATLGLAIDSSSVKDATEVLNTLIDAAERASKALDELAGKAHGGIVVQVVDRIAHVEIKPVAEPGLAGQAMAELMGDADAVQRTKTARE
jgi:hypothetical protein